MATHNQDEIDLGYVFRKIGDTFRGFLVWLFNVVNFLKRNWIIITVIIVLGALGGHIWQKSTKARKLATLIVQTNFDSASYAYTAIDLLNVKQKQGDQQFLNSYGFNGDEELMEIVIEPIVNIMDLLEKSETNDRNLEQYLSQTDFEEDLLLSEVFYPEYKYHKIYIITTNEGTDETIQKVMDYLNSNELLQATRAVVVEEIEARIVRNELSIENIDGVFDVHTGKVESNLNPSQIYFKHQENNNLHQLITVKNELIAENEDLKKSLIVYTDVIKLINTPRVHLSYTLKDRKRLLVPIGLLILFFGYHIAKYYYNKAARLAKK